MDITYTGFLMKHTTEALNAIGADVVGYGYTSVGTEAIVKLPLDGKRYRITIQEEKEII